MKPKLWIATELFFPEETSTAFILTKIANFLSQRFEVEVICAAPATDRSTKISEGYFLKEDIRIRKVTSRFQNKNSLISRSFRFLSLSLSIFFKLIFKVKKGDKVFIVTNPAPLIVLAAIAKKIKNFDLTVLVHDVFPENTVPAQIIRSENHWSYRFLKLIFDWGYASAETLIVLGRDMKEVVEEKVSRFRKKPVVQIIENWADIENIYPVNRDSIDEEVVFQYAGNIGRVQGLMELLLDIKNAGNPRLHFHFIGDGAVKKDMEAFVSHENLQNIFFGGNYKRNEQNEILNSCDIAIVTLSQGMYGLGVPSKTYNILAAGKPVMFIGNPNSEIGKLVSENGIGFVFAENDYDRRRSFFKNFNLTKEELAVMGQKSRTLAIGDYSESKILEKFERVFTGM